ncbi:hypothetical protein ACFQZE_12395 [Paenibacillus sp. GCM10027627]|uniref:hypothetical protein n=1 Tax=unclassified Paenibacillus TaxID=185978 RepID=UPI00362F72CE
MAEPLTAVVFWGSVVGQLLFAGIAVYILLKLIPRRSSRSKRLAFLKWRTVPVSDRWLKLAGVSRESAVYQEREWLLAGSGLTADPGWYMVARRMALAACLTLSTLVIGIWHQSLTDMKAGLLAVIPLLAAGGLMIDKWWLGALRKLRAIQLTKEIYVVSSQLLYLSDSALHIHTKLMRCVPYTRVMRGDIERLLAEWYYDPAIALRQFKLRLGTDDGMSFAETIDALRQHESGQYYELLRARIADYKEKLELAKESRKESTSYILFMIAGVPILYTFQVFIFPWVREGQELFQSLG